MTNNWISYYIYSKSKNIWNNRFFTANISTYDLLIFKIYLYQTLSFLKSYLIIFERPIKKKKWIKLPHLAYFSKKKMFTMSCNIKKPKQNLTTISKRKERKEKKTNIMHIRFARHLLHLWTVCHDLKDTDNRLLLYIAPLSAKMAPSASCRCFMVTKP